MQSRNSPDIFNKWGMAATIGAALQRRVWFSLQGRRLYPNLYAFLVGPPASGKSQTVLACHELVKSIPNIFVPGAKTTKEKFLDRLSKATRLVEGQSATTCAAFVTELVTFIQPNDQVFLNDLTDLYDCPGIWTYDTFKRDETRVENLFLCFLAGTTPRGLAENFTKARSGMGFLSRVNLICSDEVKPPDMYSSASVEDLTSFKEDLGQICRLKGEMRMEPNVRREIQNWIDAGMPPKINNPRLEEYQGRRILHFLKLCMIYAAADASKPDRMVITMRDYKKALGALLEAESQVNIALQFSAESPAFESIKNIEAWVLEEAKAAGGAVSESVLKRKMLEEFPPHIAGSALKELEASGFLRASYKGTTKLFTAVGPEKNRGKDKSAVQGYGN
ncbi:MAG TPA: hypothetical protein VMT20_15190 [Terriglobia bacterium]|nr:hypothetical protein [Terriglobia bacterium]